VGEVSRVLILKESLKTGWLLSNLNQLEDHSGIDLTCFEVHGCFKINTPTFYMYNAKEYRLYTLDQFEKVLNNTFNDKRFHFKDGGRSYKVKYPYFQLPEFYEPK